MHQISVSSRPHNQEYIQNRAQYTGLYLYYSRFMDGSNMRKAIAAEFRMKLATKHKRILWN